MWHTAEPVVREWIERNLGPIGRVEGAVEGAGEIGKFISQVPSLLSRSAELIDQIDDITRHGLVLSPETVEAIGDLIRGGKIRLAAENFRHFEGYALEDRNDKNASHRLNVRLAGANAGRIRTLFDEPFEVVSAYNLGSGNAIKRFYENALLIRFQPVGQ